jgi:hypothetical protein
MGFNRGFSIKGIPEPALPVSGNVVVFDGNDWIATSTLTTPITASFISGTTAQFTNITGAYISATTIDVDTLTAREYYTELVSASIIYESGSTKFGDSLDDTHVITGSLLLTGSLHEISGTLSLKDSLFVTGVTTLTTLTGSSLSGSTGQLTSLNVVTLNVSDNTILGNSLSDTTQVSGTLRVSGSQHYVTGNVDINGILQATAKSFDIEHPNKPGMRLKYGSLESPYHGVRLTGKSLVKDKNCIIVLPDYIADLVEEENINIQITNHKHNKQLWVESIDIKNNTFTVCCDEPGEYSLFWSFTAERKDISKLVVEY